MISGQETQPFKLQCSNQWHRQKQGGSEAKFEGNTDVPILKKHIYKDSWQFHCLSRLFHYQVSRSFSWCQHMSFSCCESFPHCYLLYEDLPAPYSMCTLTRDGIRRRKHRGILLCGLFFFNPDGHTSLVKCLYWMVSWSDRRRKGQAVNIIQQLKNYLGEP